MLKKIMVPILLLSCVSTSVLAANLYVRGSVMYLTTEQGAGTTGKTTRQITNFGGGYIYDKGWTIGLLSVSDSRDNNGTAENFTGNGPTVGWINRREYGFYVLGTYFLSAKRSDGYDKGTGYQLDFGYRMPLKRFWIAPELSMRNISYSESGGSSLSPTYTDNTISPTVSIWYEFGSF